MRWFGCALILMMLSASLPMGEADGQTVKIAILDSGIEPSHAEFSGTSIVAWKDFVSGVTTPYDDNGHGTAVASLAVGNTLSQGHGADLIVGKVMDDEGRPWRPWVVAGIYWAVDQGVDVISFSIGGGSNDMNVPVEADPDEPIAYWDEEYERAIDHAYERGVLIVWAAGNSGKADPEAEQSQSWTGTGTRSPRVLTVGSADTSGDRSDFSELDPEVLAVGESVKVASRFGGYFHPSGTSFSAPWAAGLAAKALMMGGHADPDWLEWVLLHCARDDPDQSYLEEGYGMLEHADAIQCVVDVATGASPEPLPDERDLYHLESTTRRSVWANQVPGGLVYTPA